MFDKKKIFSIFKEEFGWISNLKNSKDWAEEYHSRDAFERGFTHASGAAKHCVFHGDFEGYVVKFCLDSFDYCEREYTNYLAAKREGLAQYFPFTDFLGKLGPYSLFVQEEAEIDEEAVSSELLYEVANSEEEYLKTPEDEELDYDSLWDYIDDLDDESRVRYLFQNEDLVDFICAYVINDLHFGNFGYINGRLVITDFSGFGIHVRERD